VARIVGVLAGNRNSHPPTQVRKVAASANLFVCWHRGMPSLYSEFFENRQQIFFPRLPVLSNAIFHARIFSCTSPSSSFFTRVSTHGKFRGTFLPTSLLFERSFFPPFFCPLKERGGVGRGGGRGGGGGGGGGERRKFVESNGMPTLTVQRPRNPTLYFRLPC